MPRKVYWSPHGGITRTWPVEQLINAVADAGYDGIEALVAEAWMDWTDPKDVARLKDFLDSRHLECPVVCWRGNQGDRMLTDPRNRVSAQSHLEQCIDVASWMGAQSVLVWPRIAPGVARPEALATAAQILNGVGGLCQRRGVSISLEFESQGEPLCGNPAETLELISLTGDFLTICCDTLHLYNRRLDAYASVPPQRGKIGIVHLSDSDRQVPGDGEFDFPRFIEALRDIEYGGPVFVQIDPRADDDVARAYPRAVRYVEPLGE